MRLQNQTAANKFVPTDKVLVVKVLDQLMAFYDSSAPDDPARIKIQSFLLALSQLPSTLAIQGHSSYVLAWLNTDRM